MIALDLLDELRNGILRDTSALIAGPSDQLWTDARLMSYIDQAHIRFARLTQVLRDNTTPAVTQIVLVAGQSEYPLHKAVTAVLSMKYDTDTFNLPRASVDLLDTRMPADFPWFDVNQNQVLPPGRPRAWTSDQSLRTLRVYPVPTVDEAGKILQMRVARLPIITLDTLDMYAAPEIPEEYHLDMLEWAAYKALSNHEIDSGNNTDDPRLTPADRHKANFEKAVDEAITEVKRTMFAPTYWDFKSFPGVTYAR